MKFDLIVCAKRGKVYNMRTIKISEIFFIAFPDMLVFEWLTYNIKGCITRIMQFTRDLPFE